MKFEDVKAGQLYYHSGIERGKGEVGSAIIMKKEANTLQAFIVYGTHTYPGTAWFITYVRSYWDYTITFSAGEPIKPRLKDKTNIIISAFEFIYKE